MMKELVACLAAAGLLTGCGGGDSESSFTTPQSDNSDTANMVELAAASVPASIERSGIGYTWSKNTSATSNANRASKSAINDGSTTTAVVLNTAGEGGNVRWEAAGVVWSSAKTISSVKFVHGKVDGDGNGYFESGVRLQFTTNGTTWVDSAWSINPSYPNSAAAGGATYQFMGPARDGVLGVRVTGATGANSWSASISEVQVIGTNSGGAPSATSSRATSIPVGVENVNDSPLKAANYRTLLRFVPKSSIAIDRFYFGFKLRGANCDPADAAYGAGDGGQLRGDLVEIDDTTGRPGNVIATETVNGCTRHNEAKSEANGATPVLAWVNTKATLAAGKMYGLVVSNSHSNPAGNFFSFNMPIADTTLAGPHARNELSAAAAGAIMSLDPREHVAWSADGGTSWRYGSANGQYQSYLNNDDTAHPATRIPQYGFRLVDGTRLAGQPYYAYSDDCSGCTVAYPNATYARTFTQLAAYVAASTSVGTLTIRNTRTGAEASCLPSAAYGIQKCTLTSAVSVSVGDEYTVSATGPVEILKMDYSQRLLFPDVGSNRGDFRAYQPRPASGTSERDAPSIWAGPLSPYFPQ